MTDAAERNRQRQARWRARNRAGLVSLRIAAPEAELVEALIAAGLLLEHRSEDRREVELALERFIARAVRFS